MNSVFVLGAGASADVKVPLMREFLEVAEDIYRDSGPALASYADFALVVRARAELQAVHSKAEFDINNLESVFSAFEMAELLGRCKTISPFNSLIIQPPPGGARTWHQARSV
jgi:hypothetical protein